MNRKNILLILIIFVIAGIGAYFGIRFYQKSKKTTSTPVSVNYAPAATNTVSSSIPAPSQAPVEPKEEPNGLIEPVIDFKARVTKKPFGIYITPENSPVQPERFTGYHTGADAEYGDVDSDTPVYAVSDGLVEYSGTVSGYGGVLVISEQIGSEKILCLYGHVAPSSIPEKGASVVKGQTIGRLGHAYSVETDGERKHLHFGMIKGESINFKGYVPIESELSAWYNPLEFFAN